MKTRVLNYLAGRCLVWHFRLKSAALESAS